MINQNELTFFNLVLAAKVVFLIIIIIFFFIYLYLYFILFSLYFLGRLSCQRVKKKLLEQFLDYCYYYHRPSWLALNFDALKKSVSNLKERNLIWKMLRIDNVQSRWLVPGALSDSWPHLSATLCQDTNSTILFYTWCKTSSNICNY